MSMHGVGDKALKSHIMAVAGRALQKMGFEGWWSTMFMM